MPLSSSEWARLLGASVSNMKTYIIYVDGIESGIIKARTHNDAEAKAQKKHSNVDPFRVSVAYTEVIAVLRS